MKNERSTTAKTVFIKAGIAVTLAVLTVFLSGCVGIAVGFLAGLRKNNTESDYEPGTYTIQETFDFEVEEKSEPLEVEYYFENTIGGNFFVYDSDYLYKIFDAEKVTKNDLLSALEQNPDISEKYKAFIREYIDLLYKRYPDNNYRIFYENLKTMKVVECKDKFELFDHTLSLDAFACYVAMENSIYTMYDYDYVKGTWDYQVIMHEISHALRTYRNDDAGKVAEFTDLSTGSVILEEALNSVFTVSLFDYEERDIAYQFQSNIIQAVVSSMDNYDLNDYVNHSTSYFCQKLDEFTGHGNYASVMLKVMEMQYKDYHEDYIDIKEEEFYPFYRYICDIYFKNRLKADMTNEEKDNVISELVERLMFDVPEEYHVDTDYFYKYYNEYLQAHGIPLDTAAE